MAFITKGQEVSFGYPGVEANMRLTQAYRSLSRPSSVVLPRHPLHSFYAANYSSRSISPTTAQWILFFKVQFFFRKIVLLARLVLFYFVFNLFCFDHLILIFFYCELLNYDISPRWM